MNLHDYFETIDLAEIDRFIDEKQEEHLHLEFKTVNHPNYTEGSKDHDRKNFSEALSGFANSAGGIIVWGIKASVNERGQDVAKLKKPIQQLTKFLTGLNKDEGTIVTPPVTGVIHKKIEVSDDCGYVKTYVPPSSNAPHMANNAGKHYYKRSGHSFYPCEHYDIVDMFSRRTSPKLRLIAKVLKKQDWAHLECIYSVLISIVNEGKVIAKYPYLALNPSKPFRRSEYGIDGNTRCGLIRVVNNISYADNYSGGDQIVIYPETTLDVDILSTKIKISDSLPDLTIEYLLAAENMESIKGEIHIEKERLIRESE